MLLSRAWQLIPLLLLVSCANQVANVDLPAETAVQPVLVLLTNDPTATAPVLGYDGSVYFSHARNVRVVLPNGRHHLFTRLADPVGHRILADRTHLVCDAGRMVVLHLDAEGRILRSLTKHEGQKLGSPQGLAVDQWNGFYFTDAGDEASGSPAGIYHVTSDWKSTRVAEGLASPGALALSADWTTLYVIERGRHRILGYDVTGQGRLGKQRVFCTLPMDESNQPGNEAGGLALDVLGNVYVPDAANKQVMVLSRQGRLIRRYATKVQPTDLCFGGPNLDQLFVTVKKPGALFRMHIGVRGVDIRPKR